MSGITVTGGVDGITARTDDLLAMASLLQAGAASIGDALDQLSAPVLRLQLTADGGHDPIGALLVQHELQVVAGPFGQLAAAAEHLETLAHRLRAAVEMYRQADDTVLDSIVGGLGHLFAGGLFATLGDDDKAARQFYAGLPGLTDLSMSVFGQFETPFAAAIPDGHAVLHDLGTDERPAVTTPPPSVAGLIAELAVRNEGRHGEISVSVVVGADGSRRAIVDIPGTKSWNPVPTHDVTSVGTDIRALAGHDTAYEDGVLAALTAAGVTKDDDVMLVGHSEGGIVAVNAARDAVRSGRFRITHVVTAGSPIGRISRQLPESVQVLALENSADVVPHCDAADNPDRRDITTVTATEQHFNIVDNHDLTDSYEPIADAADHSDNASVRAFTRSAHGFLSGTAMHTHAYWITRGF
jgi:hypothetical protein